MSDISSRVRQDEEGTLYCCGECGQWSRRAWLWGGKLYGLCCWQRLQVNSLTERVIYARDVARALRAAAGQRRRGK